MGRYVKNDIVDKVLLICINFRHILSHNNEWAVLVVNLDLPTQPFVLSGCLISKYKVYTICINAIYIILL